MSLPLPTPSGDPTGFAAGVVLFSGAILTAVDPTGALGGRWQPVIQAAVALAALGWARRHAWRPLKVWQAADEARGSERVGAVERDAAAKRRRSDHEK